MNVSLVDTHCHLDAQTFHPEIDEIIERAKTAGLQRMVTIGTNLESSQAAIVLANRYSCVSAVVGIHPNYVQEAGPADWESIVQLASHPQVVGVGETGLDKYWDHSPLPLQQDYFERHMQLSRTLGKPFIVHCREAEPDVLNLLRQDFHAGPLNGVMHAFCGDAEMAAECVEMGMYISFAGMVTFRKNEQMRDVAKSIPLEKLLVETDAPYLAPHPNRGKRNEPAWVRLTAQCLADVHQISLEDLATATTANAQRLFTLPAS